MLSIDAWLPGDNAEIEAGGVKKSVASRQQKSKTGKVNPNRAAGEGQGQAGLQIQQAPFLGHKSTEILSAEMSSPPEERERERRG